MFAACLYRLGRYNDALAELRKEKMKDFPAQVGRVVLTNSFAATAPMHGIAALAHPNNRLPTLKEDSFPALRAMCHHKLGQAALTQKHLTTAAAAQQAEDKRANPPLGSFPGFPPQEIPLYREAVELITGKPLPERKK